MSLTGKLYLKPLPDSVPLIAKQNSRHKISQLAFVVLGIADNDNQINDMPLAGRSPVQADHAPLPHSYKFSAFLLENLY